MPLHAPVADVRRPRESAASGDGNAGDGLSPPIDPELPIEDVVLSQRMHRPQVDRFHELRKRLRFGPPVHASSLLTSPFRERATSRC